jgi:hypothetical protein
MNWEKADTAFIESDVVAWTESIWPPHSPRRRKKSRPWGKQKVTAQVTAIDGDYLTLAVLKAEILENTIGSKLKPHKVGSLIKKKHSTLLRGEPERLLWSEEGVRKTLHDDIPR